MSRNQTGFVGRKTSLWYDIKYCDNFPIKKKLEIKCFSYNRFKLINNYCFALTLLPQMYLYTEQ